MSDPTNPTANGEQRKDSDIFKDLILNYDDVNQMANSDFLVPNMIVQGHITLFAAPANGGKSTLFIYLCEQLAAKRLDVLYINADSSPGDLKAHHSHATCHGYLIISPDTKVGQGIGSVLSLFESIINSTATCNTVFILDTVKKFVDMLDKKQLKTFFATLRAMTIKGATICLLGHTNKYLGKDGNSIFEGMGDVRTDIDDLIYLDSSRNPDTGYLEVTTRPDKIRANFYPRSFVIELPSRFVRESKSVISIYSDEEAKLLQLVLNSIQKGCISQQDILNDVKSKTTMGINAIRSSLFNFTHASDARITNTLSPSGKGYIYSVK
jgi:hypothetical protein